MLHTSNSAQYTPIPILSVVNIETRVWKGSLLMRLLIFSGFILGAWQWGDWKNWKVYYSTILFFILASFYYISIYHNYPLWRYEPLPPLNHILSNSTLIAVAITFIVFPCTTLIYLGNYPDGKKQYFYLVFWITLYTLIELVMFLLHGITYHHDWNLAWSIVFNIALFSSIRLHFLRPWFGWVTGIVFALFFAFVFGFPINQS